jgi:sporulation protein YunB
MAMRKKWGSSLPVKWRQLSLPKSAPRKWGRRRRFAIPRPSGTGFPSAPKFAPRRPRKRMKRRVKWLIALLVLLFVALQSMLFLDRELREPLMFLAKIRINQMATEAINTAITDEIAQSADSEKLIQWKTDESGKIKGFLIDYKQQMSLTAKTIAVVNRVLKEREDVPERIPIGHALNSPFISSLGPSVSVKFHPASAVKVDVDTKQSSAGINMLLVEVFVRIKADIAVVIPFDQEPQSIASEIPLSYVLVVGDVPTYYYDGQGNPTGSGAGQAPALSIPALPEASAVPDHS